MAKLKYRIQFTGSGGFATNDEAGIISAYLGGATGTPQTRAYEILDAPPAFVNYPLALGYIDGPAIDDGDYFVDFKDNTTASKLLAQIALIPFASSCWDDGNYANPIFELIRFEGSVMVRAHTSPGAGCQASIDGGATWKTLVFSDVGTEASWTNAEIAAMSITDTIPTIKIKRTKITNIQAITSFLDPTDVDWPPAFFTRANIADTSGILVGTVIPFFNSSLYGSGGFVVEVGAAHVVFQHSFVGTQGGVTTGTPVPCEKTIAENMFIGEISLSPLAVSETHTNETSAPADDGTINLTPSGGSGDYSYSWNDGSTAQNRSGLHASIYTVTITDNVTTEEVELEIEITEPAPEPPPVGTYLDIPKIQSLRFVREAIIDNCNTFQNFDNTLFCKMVFPGVKIRKPFYQKVCKCDILTIQVHSNFPNHTNELINATTGLVAKAFNNLELKQQLTGLSSSYGVQLTNAGVDDPAGTSRVIFLSGTIPIPLENGETFTLINNADGFNGVYEIVGISNDPLLGTPYLLINLVYDAPNPTSEATSIFLTNTVEFDVYEMILDFQDVAEGLYYMRVRGINLDDAYTEWVSEPIHLKTTHAFTHLVEFRNFDNFADVVYTTGITHKIRLESKLQKPLTSSADENYRESNGSPIKQTSRPQRKWKFEIFDQPFYRLELLRVMWGMDQVLVNKIEYESDENTGEPANRDFYLLANVAVTIEQKQWFAQYNGDDLGSVDPGYILTQFGYIQRT